MPVIKRTPARPSAVSPKSAASAKPTTSTKVGSKAPVVEEVATDAIVSATGVFGEAATTRSVSRRISGSDDVFVSVGVKWPFPFSADADENAANLDAAFTSAETFVKEKLDAALADLPDVAALADGEEVEADDEAGDEAEDDTVEGEGDDEGGEDLTEEEVLKMAKPELLNLAKEYELEVNTKLKAPALAKEIVALLFTDEDEAEAGDEEEGEEADEAEGEEADGEEGEESQLYDEAELKALKLEGLLEIVTAWELKATPPKGADLAAKKAFYVKAILKAQGQ